MCNKQQADDARRAMKISQEMAAARLAQQREKECRLATQAQFEKDEFLHLAAVAAQQAEVIFNKLLYFLQIL